MPQRLFNRAQVFLVPPSLDDWLPADQPARFVAALLGIWVYGFMAGIRSTRGLEAACRDQVPFRWLSGNQTPDHNTLARFYQTHQEGMRELFRQTVTVAVRAGLVDWALLATNVTCRCPSAGLALSRMIPATIVYANGRREKRRAAAWTLTASIS